MTRVRLPVRGPFHLEATVRLLQRIPSNVVDRWEGRRHLRLFEIGEALYLTATANEGTRERPALVTEITGRPRPPAMRQIEQGLRRLLGLDQPAELFESFARGEPALAHVATVLRGARPPRYPTLFEAFANTIPFQQVSLASGVATVARLVERFGRAEGGLVAFPSAALFAAADAADMRGLGLSAAKAAALRAAAHQIAAGTLREGDLEALPSGEAMARLVSLPGIGAWSAALLLLRGFGRLDVFPSGDAGAARGLRDLLGLPPEASFRPDLFAERFGRRRGGLYFLTLGARLLRAGLISGGDEVEVPLAPPSR